MSGFSFGAPAAAGGGLFGGAASAPTGSLFGAKPAAPAGGLFGAAAPAGGSLFGAPAASAPATGLFGAASAAPAPGGLFGASAAPAAGGLFGAASAAPAASSFGASGFGASAFGAKPANTGFGAFGAASTATAPATTSLFGAPKPFGAPAFGASTTAAPAPSAPSFGASLASGQRQQFVIGNVKPQIPVWQLLMNIKNAWDPTHPNCAFKHFFYNFVHPDDVNKYGPPPNVEVYDWNQALQECPDRECMVPALAVGFDDLKKRMEAQNDMTEMQRIKLEEIEAKMSQITQFHMLQTASKVREFKRRHIQLAQRVLTLMKRVQILRNRGVPLRADEEILRVRLENALEQLRNPAHFRGKITELWAQLQILKDSKRLHPAGNYEVSDEAQLEGISKVLQDHQAGLHQMTMVLQQDMQDIETLQRKLEEMGSGAKS
ncbi:MAG: nucleoporin complex subunit 54-domain-containing protein [Linnemannia elongata]|nr:MAG: nucleoporin complex subunit 54-domain-containing protein [Linnemannia elongata]